VPELPAVDADRSPARRAVVGAPEADRPVAIRGRDRVAARRERDALDAVARLVTAGSSAATATSAAAASATAADSATASSAAATSASAAATSSSCAAAPVLRHACRSPFAARRTMKIATRRGIRSR
jgi:hypothetical protein